MTTFIFADLQKNDGEAERLRQRLTAIGQQRADRHALDDAATRLHTTQATAAQQRQQLRDRELELKSLEGKLKDVDEKLYSGRIRNPKELENLQKESQSVKQHQGKLEEAVLGLMEAQDQADMAAQQAQTTLLKLQNERQKQEADWLDEEEVVARRLKEVEAKLQSLRTAVDGEALQRYDKLRRTRGLAVATLNGHSCAVCGMSVSLEIIQMARDEETLATCNSCGRILVHGNI